MRKTLLALGFLLVSVPAHALVWPDVPEQIEHALQSQDPATRRAAAVQIRSLGPSRGAPMSLRALADPDIEVRLAAAESAIALHVTAATEEVTAWLGDREVRLRIAACTVARAMPNERAVAPLARALGDGDPGVRSAAADALGVQNSPDTVPPLLGRLDDPTPAVRVQVVRSLARIGDTRAVVPLVGKVEDSVPEVRQAVAQALGELGDKRASQALVLQLRDANVDVQLGALEALGRLRTSDAIDAISPFLTDRNPTLRQAALVALGRVATIEAVRALIGNLGFGDDANGGIDRTAVRDALVSAGANAVAPLTTLLDGSPTPHAASSAAWVLGELQARGSAAKIVAAMRRGVVPPGPALHALAGAGSSDSIPVVLEFADDPSPLVRAEAARTAEKLLDPAHPDGRAVEPLAAALRDPALQVSERATLTRLLGRTGAPRAAPILLALLNAKDADLKTAAIDGLASLGPAGADDALVKVLADTDPSVRLHAAIALADSGGPRARESLLAKMNTSDEIDRGSLLVALRGVLSRAPSDDAVARLSSSFELAVGAERDAILTVVSRANIPRALAVLQNAARSQDAEDRKAAAAGLANFSAGAQLLVPLLADREPAVRAQAAWSCGFVCGPDALPKLISLALEHDADTSANAIAAVGKIAARAKNPGAVTSALCSRMEDTRPIVRMNSVTAAMTAGVRCNGAERRLLESDPSEAVRLAAARAVGKGAAKEDTTALERCARADRSGPVASRCRDAMRGETSAALPTHAVEIYVVPGGQQNPEPRARYALSLSDGFAHTGNADRRGAVFEAFAPSGQIELLRPE